MHIEPDLKLYQQSGENMGANRFLIDVSSSWFIKAVLAACWMLQRFIDPDSKSYVEPKEYYGADFDGENRAFFNANFLGTNERSSFNLAYTAWSGLELIHAYVEWRNNIHKTTWIVGEDHTTHQIVYNTLALLHNYNVRCIEDSHRKNGRTFGSATRFQKESPMAQVCNWPDIYDHVGPRPDMLSWPCKRPNYLRDDPFVKGSNMTTVNVEAEADSASDTSFALDPSSSPSPALGKSSSLDEEPKVPGCHGYREDDQVESRRTRTPGRRPIRHHLDDGTDNFSIDDDE